jgi:2'-hydroxyisoflavone reductase
MKLLILGGTIFLGRHVVECALANGHDVTIFHRGKHGADLFPEVERILGDRDGGLEPLRGRRFDAVIDPSGYVPRVVRASAELLSDATEHYAFVSSLSVYADDSTPGQDESGPLVELDDPATEEITGETYGGLKVLCERAVTDVFGDRALNFRPGLIVGPHDPTDRFTWWPVRVARGGRVIAPAPEDGPVEFSDVRDLAAFLVHAAERRTGGVLNASGPAIERPTFGRFLAACRETAGSDAEFVWVDEAFMEAQGIGPWMDLPLFAGTDVPGFSTRDSGAALAAGLTFRPMTETIRDTLEWARSRPADHEWRAGLTAEREAAALKALP